MRWTIANTHVHFCSPSICFLSIAPRWSIARSFVYCRYRQRVIRANTTKLWHVSEHFTEWKATLCDFVMLKYDFPDWKQSLNSNKGQGQTRTEKQPRILRSWGEPPWYFFKFSHDFLHSGTFKIFLAGPFADIKIIFFFLGLDIMPFWVSTVCYKMWL